MDSFFDPEAYRLVRNIMIGFAVFYVVFEVFLNLNDLENDTSNIILYEAAKDKLFFIPFALGAIMGHLFLGTTQSFFYIGNSWPVIALFGICLVMLAISYRYKFEKSRWFFTLLLVLGVGYGHFFWSMNF